ncbi:hypothetical protein HY480_03755 [Candidatus Uhrbacteria bacterium]|nr:hypothetical protein [Candidatus Uhrbacteria bacterium]
MRTFSAVPVPVQGEWQQPAHAPPSVRKKEVPGVRSIFHRHCGTSMQRVITFEKIEDEGVRCVGCRSWICRICGKREYPTDYGPMG